MCADLQFRWTQALFLRADRTLWRVDRSGRGDQAGLADLALVPLCAGDQTAEALSTGGNGTSAIPGMNKTVGVIFHKTGKNNAEVGSRAGFQPIFSLSMGNLRH